MTGLSKDPGLLPPAVPAAATLPVGLRVQSIPGPGEQPQTFETVEEIEARPEWNALPLAATQAAPADLGATRRLARRRGAQPAARATPCCSPSTDLVNDRWDVRLLTDVEHRSGRRPHARDAGTTASAPCTRRNNPADAPDAFVLRKRFSVFGHNAPIWPAMPQSSFRHGYVVAFPYPPGADKNEWPQFNVGHLVRRPRHARPGRRAQGRRAGLVGRRAREEGASFYRELYRVVVGVASCPASAFAVSGTVTRLMLAGRAARPSAPRATSPSSRSPSR